MEKCMTDTPDPIAAVQALLDERAVCEERIKEINILLHEVRRKIDMRTVEPTTRRLRAVKPADAGDAPDAPEAA